MRRETERFEQPFCADCLRQLNAATLRDLRGCDLEERAFAAGKRLKAGQHALELLLQIAQWKSPRRRALLEGNTDAELRRAIAVARGRADVETKMAALTALKGIGIPMATAVLAAMDPNRYLVMDVRALDALGVRGKAPTARLYAAYLEFCRNAANGVDMSLRDLDRALWKAGTP